MKYYRFPFLFYIKMNARNSMMNLSDFVIYEELKKNFNDYLIDNLRVALHCYDKTGFGFDLEYFKPRIFESYKYNFDNCSEVVKEVLEYLESIEPHEHSRIFKFDNIVFFNKPQIKFATRERSTYIKSKSKKGVVYLTIRILNVPIEEYDIKQRRFLIYSIIHELTHAYEDYLIRLEGKPSIIYLMKNKKYAREYTTANLFMKGNTLASSLAKCKYFLDDHEMVAYLGTVKETVKNIFNKIKPSYKDLKFDELLELFSEEYVWDNYVKINVFMETIDDIDKDRFANVYKQVFRYSIDYDEYVKELKTKWEKFKSEFVEAFIEGYADCEENLTFESFVSFPAEYYNDPYYGI